MVFLSPLDVILLALSHSEEGHVLFLLYNKLYPDNFTNDQTLSINFIKLLALLAIESTCPGKWKAKKLILSGQFTRFLVMLRISARELS